MEVYVGWLLGVSPEALELVRLWLKEEQAAVKPRYLEGLTWKCHQEGFRS